MMLIKRRRYHAWNDLWSTWQQVGSWRQHIWFGFGRSKLIWRATLWVPDTCLIKGFLPFMIILITASLSSKIYNWASNGEESAFVTTCSTFDDSSTTRFHPLWFGDFLYDSGLKLLDVCFLRRMQHRAGLPSIRKTASKEFFFVSVEVWDTDVRFLHIQLMVTDVRLPKIQKIPSEVDFWVFKVSTKNLSLGIYPVDNAGPCFTHDNIVGNHLCDECMKSTELNVCRKHLSILWLLLQSCLQTKECQVYQFVTNTNILRQSKRILLTILQMIPVPPSWSDGHPSKELRLCTTALSLSFCLPIHSFVQRIFFAWPGTTLQFLRDVSHTLAIFQLLQQQFVIRTSFCTREKWFRSVCIHVGCIPNTRGQEMMLGSPRSTSFINFFHMGAIVCFLPTILMSSMYTDKNNPCFQWTNRHSPFGTLFLPSPNRTSSNCLSHKRPASGCPCRFLLREITGSSMFDHDLGDLFRGRRIYISGHSDFGFLNNYGPFSILRGLGCEQILRRLLVLRLRKGRDTASAACPSQSGCLAKTSTTFAAVIWDADEPCSVKTAQDPESSFTTSPRRTTRPLYFWYFGSVAWRALHTSIVELFQHLHSQFFVILQFLGTTCTIFLQSFVSFSDCSHSQLFSRWAWSDNWFAWWSSILWDSSCLPVS